MEAESKNKKFVVHGHAVRGAMTPTYRSWREMKSRCLNPRNDRYADYGGRGISVCERWRKSFAAFLQDVGERPSGDFSIDRIDNNGNYEPGNVRWLSEALQHRNKRSNRLVEIDGVSRCIAEWSEVSGVSQFRISARLIKGWDAKDAVFTPVRRLVRVKNNQQRSATSA